MSVVVIGGVDQLEVNDMKSSMLQIGDSVADILFLHHYFKLGKDEVAAREAALDYVAKSYVSLGPVFITQVLRQAGFTAELVPNYLKPNFPLFEQLVRNSAFLVVSTTMMLSQLSVLAICNHAKRVNPNIITIAGGMTVYKYQKMVEYIEKAGMKVDNLPPFFKASINAYLHPGGPVVDYMIVSTAGEDSMVKLLLSLVKGDDSWKAASNIYAYNKEQDKFSPTAVVADPTSHVLVDWSKFAHMFPPAAWYPVQVGQGCPFRCKFCDFVGISPKVIRTDINQVFDCIASIPLYNGVRRVAFTNDNLLINRSSAKEFLTALIEKDLKVKFRAFIRADSVQDEEIADLLAKAGCVRAAIGMESGDLTILQNMDKHCTPEMLERCHNLLVSRGIIVFNTVIVGFPGETEESVQHTADVLNKIPPTVATSVGVFRFIVMPLSPIAHPQERAKYNLKGMGGVWSHNTMDSDTAVKLVESMHARLKPHISIHYAGEEYIDDVLALPLEHKRELNHIRNTLVLRKKGLPDNDPRSDAELWKALEHEISFYHNEPEVTFA